MKHFYPLSRTISAFIACLFLLTASAQDKTGTAKALLRHNLMATGLTQAIVDSSIVTDAYTDATSGNYLVYLQQTYLGIPVYHKISVFIFNKDTLAGKKVDRVAGIAMPDGVRTIRRVSAEQAIRSAANHLGIAVGAAPRLMRGDEIRQRFVFREAAISRRDIPSDLVWLPVNQGKELKLSWNVRIAVPGKLDEWFVRVDAQTGQVLEKSSLIVSEKPVECLADDGSTGTRTGGVSATVLGPASVTGFVPPPAVTDASYRVYPFPLESANFGPRSVDTDPWLKAGSGNSATTLGWHFDNTTNYVFTRGNNVWAQEDLAGTSGTTGLADTSITATPTLTFDRPIDDALPVTSYGNIRAGIDNLFYWNNLMHDVSYQYGFDEAAGNFQASNLGRGGAEGDYVHAFAQDGAGLNNSDFLTLPDGENPVMRMFVWNSAVTTSFVVNAPPAVAGSYQAVEGALSSNNSLLKTGPVTGNIVLVVDGGGTHAACGTISNAASLPGNIAMIDRGGGCNFTVKIKNAQNAGAIGVIMVDNVSGAPTIMGGTDNTITIPAVMISLADGNLLKSNTTGLNGTLSDNGNLIDGTRDNGVISHEYTHGISNRLTGGPANADCLNNAEQAGEGWSDFMALMMTTDWSTAATTDGPKKRTLGTYVMAQPPTGAGIRTYPYSTDMSVNPWTYGMMAGTNGEPHTIGEIWCVTLWDMTWNIIAQEGIDPDLYHGTKGNNIALQLVIEGLKLQPCSPGYLDGRDAILKADSLLYNNVHKCAIWNAFARRGMGKSAVQGSSDDYTDQVAATDLPSGVGLHTTANKTIAASGDNITYTLTASCDCTPLSNISIRDTLAAGLGFFTASPSGVYTAPVMRWDNQSFAANETKTYTMVATVTGTYSLPDTLLYDNSEANQYPWTQTVTLGPNLWNRTTTRAHSGTQSWRAPEAGGGAGKTDFAIQSAGVLLDAMSTLSFWHYFETDAGFDGGVVEISIDGGSSWQDLGPGMTQNPYNTTLDALSSPLPGRAAFAGSSGGSFIQTVVSLTGFAGKTAMIRFRFATSGGEPPVDGWYVDDIVLSNEQSAVNLTSAFSGSSLLARNTSVIPLTPGALPVNFLGFTAKKQNRTALLNWEVSGAVDVDKYVIERSGDGGAFVAIGEVVPNAPNETTGAYDFVDAQMLEGNNYYRIVEKDKDGKPTTSPVRLLNFSSNGLTLRVYPVPTYTHSVQLELQMEGDATVTGSLVSTTGATLQHFVLKKGVSTLKLGGFAAGIYFLRIQLADGTAEVKKIVVQ